MHKQTALTILAECEFKPFDEMDWMAFAGCESKFPLICDNRNDYVIIMDGGSFSFYPTESNESDMAEWHMFKMGDLV